MSPFEIEVGRTAHEIAERHGRKAYAFATSQAERALAENDIDGHRFWKAVEAALKPRDVPGA